MSKCEVIYARALSSFFRNPIVFEIILQSVIPERIQTKKADGQIDIRVWSAGFANGEEAYSIAILLNEAFQSILSGDEI